MPARLFLLDFIARIMLPEELHDVFREAIS